MTDDEAAAHVYDDFVQECRLVVARDVCPCCCERRKVEFLRDNWLAVTSFRIPVEIAPRLSVDDVDGAVITIVTFVAFLLAIDASAGAQRVVRHGDAGVAGAWRPALRLWSLLLVRAGALGSIGVELDAERSLEGEPPALADHGIPAPRPDVAAAGLSEKMRIS